MLVVQAKVLQVVRLHPQLARLVFRHGSVLVHGVVAIDLVLAVGWAVDVHVRLQHSLERS